MEYKYNNFGTVFPAYVRDHGNFMATWYGTDDEAQTENGFKTRKDANDFLRSKGIAVCSKSEYKKRKQYRRKIQ